MRHSAGVQVKSDDRVSPLASAPSACAAPRPCGVRDNAPALRQSLVAWPVAIEAAWSAAFIAERALREDTRGFLPPAALLKGVVVGVDGDK
jgi:hypothetical protein